jgi:hypothetical protein
VTATTAGEAPAEWTLVAVPGPGGEVLEVLAFGLDLRERLLAQEREARWSAFRKNLLRVYETLMAEGFSESVFGLILEAALDTVPAAQAGSVTILKEDGYYHFVAAKGTTWRPCARSGSTRKSLSPSPGTGRPRSSPRRTSSASTGGWTPSGKRLWKQRGG